MARAAATAAATGERIAARRAMAVVFMVETFRNSGLQRSEVIGESAESGGVTADDDGEDEPTKLSSKTVDVRAAAPLERENWRKSAEKRLM
jgi:hypothetical protein